jgi:predicted aspartyl protease
MKSDGIYVNMMVNNFAVDFLVDTGPEVTVLPISYAKHICPHYTGKKMGGNRSGGKTDMKQTKPLSISIGPMKIDAGVWIGSFEQPILGFDVIM